MFMVSTTTIEVRKHERRIIAESEEQALAEYAKGTAWPGDYDTRTVRVEYCQPTDVEEVEGEDLVIYGNLQSRTNSVYWTDELESKLEPVDEYGPGDPEFDDFILGEESL